jgi:hypothetical protein
LGRPPQLSPACPPCGSPVPTRGHRRHRQGAALCGQVHEGLPAPHRAAVDAAMRLPGVAFLGHHSPFRVVTSLRLNGRRGSRKVPSWVSPVTRCHEAVRPPAGRAVRTIPTDSSAPPARRARCGRRWREIGSMARATSSAVLAHPHLTGTGSRRSTTSRARPTRTSYSITTRRSLIRETEDT